MIDHHPQSWLRQLPRHNPALLSVLLFLGSVLLKREISALHSKAYVAHILKSSAPTPLPSIRPSTLPTLIPTATPTGKPTPAPSAGPSPQPTPQPTPSPSALPFPLPTAGPSPTPSPLPTLPPSPVPTTRRKKKVSRAVARRGYYLKRRADAGDTGAMVQLAFLYTTPQRGVGQNFKEAAKWYGKAAEAGSAVGMYNMGLLYYHGKGVEKDLSKARESYSRAAHLGHAGAQFNLGSMLARGEGLAGARSDANDTNAGVGGGRRGGRGGDANAAMLWLGKAAEQGVRQAKAIIADHSAAAAAAASSRRIRSSSSSSSTRSRNAAAANQRAMGLEEEAPD